MTSPTPDFNPYHAWLGLDRSITKPNYYQLLGINPQERDAGRIAAAAQRAATRVRGFRPGSRSAEWARVLDEIDAARLCLADPVKRADYQRQQTAAGGPAARSFSRPAPRGTQPIAPTPTRPAATQPRAVPMSAPRPQSASQPEGVPMGAPVAGQGQVPTGVPIGVTVPKTGALIVQAKSTSVAAARKTNRSMLTPAAIAAAACLILLVAVLILVVAFKGPSTKKRRPAPPPVAKNQTPIDRAPSTTHPPRERFTRPHQTPGLDNLQPAVTESPRKSEPSTETEPGVGTVEPAADPDDETWTMPTFPKLDMSLTPDDSATVAPSIPADSVAPSVPEPGTTATPAPPIDPGDASPTTAGSGSPTVPRVPAITDAPESMANPGPEPLAEPTPEPIAEPNPVAPADSPDSAFQPKSEDVAALSTALKAARTAVMKREFATAIDQLNRLTSIPKTAEQQALCDRLNLLAQYAQNFRSALSEAVAALEAGDEIEVGESTVVGVVQVTGDRVTFRSQGRNVTRAMDDLPPGLAVAIASRWLAKDDPVSLVVKGAYLVARQDATETELAKARQWWSEAASAGFDIGDLPKVIDDSYDLQAKPGQ